MAGNLPKLCSMFLSCDCWLCYQNAFLNLPAAPVEGKHCWSCWHLIVQQRPGIQGFFATDLTLSNTSVHHRGRVELVNECESTLQVGFGRQRCSHSEALQILQRIPISRASGSVQSPWMIVSFLAPFAVRWRWMQVLSQMHVWSKRAFLQALLHKLQIEARLSSNNFCRHVDLLRLHEYLYVCATAVKQFCDREHHSSSPRRIQTWATQESIAYAARHNAFPSLCCFVGFNRSSTTYTCSSFVPRWSTFILASSPSCLCLASFCWIACASLYKSSNPADPGGRFFSHKCCRDWVKSGICKSTKKQIIIPVIVVNPFIARIWNLYCS